MSDRGEPTVAATQPQKPIPAAIERLANQLSMLGEEAGLLDEALVSVRSPSPSACKEETGPRDPGLADDIATHADRVEEILCRLRGIRENLLL